MASRMIQFGRNTLAAAVGLAVLAPTTTLAQGLILEEVVVTAQKREERSMDVPIAIGTFTPQNLEDTGALSVQDIDAFIPGFESETDQFTQNKVTIRGVSTPIISTGGDPSVATFYDDVYVPPAASTVPFSDIASIEILKGPQGTLFGRNAAAGVVSIQPNKPAEDTEGFISTRIGNYGLQRVEGMVNVAVTDDVFIRANILNSQRDGYKENVTPGGRNSEEQDVTAGRIALLWEATEDTSAQFSFDFDDIDNGAKQTVGVLAGGEVSNPFRSKVENDVDTIGETRENYAYTAKLFHNLNDDLSVKVVTSYRDFKTTNLIDEDGTANSATQLHSNNIEDSDIFYSEVQFTYLAENITAVFGANYSEEDVFQNTVVTATSDSLNTAIGIDAFPSGLGMVERIENIGDFSNYGIYGDITYDIADDWTITGGLRYSKDEKEFSWFIPVNALVGANVIFNPVIETPVEASDSWDKVTGRALVKYQINDDLMTYLSYSTGYKSGGYDSLSFDTAAEPFEPEETTNYEWGIKGSFFDNSFRVQASIFRLELDGKIVSRDSLLPDAIGAIPVIVSGDETIDGFELTLDWLATDTVRLGLVTTVRDHDEDLEDFIDSTGMLAESVDLDFNTEYTLTFDWAPEVDFGEILLHIDYEYAEDRLTDEAGFNEAFLVVDGVGDDTENLNARLAWTNNDDNLTVGLWAQNILDNERVKGTSNFSFATLGTGAVEVDPPKTYGIDVKYTF